MRLNAPYGARCFLTMLTIAVKLSLSSAVLMYLMVLGAF